MMVLDDVADRAGLIVKGASALHAEILRHGDLHALDVSSGSRTDSRNELANRKYSMLWTGCFPR